MDRLLRPLHRLGWCEARGYLDGPAFFDRSRDCLQNFDDVRGLCTRRTLRAILGDGVAQLDHRPAPLGTRVRLLDVGYGLVALAELAELHGRIEVLPAIHIERAQVAVKLNALLLAVLTD